VPVGDAHTRAGALAAALNYVGVVGNPGVLVDVGRLRQALSVLATPRLTKRVLAGYGQAAHRLGQSSLVRSLRSGAPAIAMGVPVAYRVLRSGRDRLVAEFWTVGVAGDVQGTSPYAVWRRSTATFGWVDGDWKLVAPLEHQGRPRAGIGT
jgi:hypothetical protein